MSKLRAAIVAIVVGLGLSLAVVGCSSSSGNSGDKMGNKMSGDNKMNADKIEGVGKMSSGKMGDKMSGENKMSGDSKMAADKMSGEK
jgi:hypothetical protein